MLDSPFWRTEVWHPLVVHFPVALLLFATFLQAFSVLFKSSGSLLKFTALLLYVGSATAWLSIYTGDLADGIVSRNLCDPTVLKDHENAAYNLSYVFTGAAVLAILNQLNLFKGSKRLLNISILLLMLIGSYYLVRAGHSGASVVYEQAGGVQIPSSDCREF